MEKKSFQQGMAYLAAAYAAEIGVERAAVYWDQLRDFPDGAFLRGVRVVVATDERFPMVAQLREAVMRPRVCCVRAAIRTNKSAGFGDTAGSMIDRWVQGPLSVSCRLFLRR